MAAIDPAMGGGQRQQLPAVKIKGWRHAEKQRHIDPRMHKIRELLEIMKMTELQSREAQQQQSSGPARAERRRARRSNAPAKLKAEPCTPKNRSGVLLAEAFRALD